MINRDKMVEDAIRIFVRKIASGNYKNYSDQEMEQLFADCLKQCSAIQKMGGEEICLKNPGINLTLKLSMLME